MSRQDAPLPQDVERAEQLLHSVRRAVTPTRADAARTLAGIEARLGLALGAPSSLSETPTPAAGARAPSVPTAPQAGLGSNALPSAAANPFAQGLTQRFARPLARGALLVAFGLGTGTLGYFLGRAQAPHREPSTLAAPTFPAPPLPQAASLPVSAPVSAPAVRASPVSSPGAAPRAEELPSAAPDIPEPRSVASAAPADAHPHRARRSSRGLLPGAPARSSSDPGSALREALELLGRAEAALRRRDGLAARMWLSDLERRAAAEVLREERLVAATLASCLLEDLSGARQTLRELAQLNPESMYRSRLEGSCVGDFSAGSDSKIGGAGH